MEWLRKMKEFYGPYRKYFIITLFAVLATTATRLVEPLLIKFLIDDVIDQKEFGLILYGSILAIIVAAGLRGLFQFVFQYSGQLFGIKSVYHLRNALYQKLQALSFGYYSRAKTGDLMARLTGDVETIRGLLSNTAARLFQFVVMTVAGLGMMAFYSWKLTIVMVVAMAALAVTSSRFSRVVRPTFRLIRKRLGELNTAIQENVMGIRTVKSFAQEAFETEKFSSRNSEYKHAQIKSSRIWSRYFPMMEMWGNLTIVILLGYGGYLVIGEQLSLGTLVAFFSLARFMIAPLPNLGFMFNQMMQSFTASERIFRILDEEEDIRDLAQPQALQNVKGEICFKDVTFRYNRGETVLKNINIDAPAGNNIAILGGTGSGKSSIIQLVCRAYDVSDGQVLFDGIDVRALPLSDLRRQIGMVTQEPFIFSATIRDNICYGDPFAPMEKVVHAAQMAQAHDFIQEFPQGYETLVGERGLGLSGGQKQRIAIARALLVNPKVLILDDATSAVDMETEFQIMKNLREFMKDRTTFIIAHRISSLKHADEIIVLDDGQIVEKGTHETLINQNGIYKKTYERQISDGEAEQKQARRVRAL